MADVTEQFSDLFQGNTRAVGTEKGGCYHIPGLVMNQQEMFTNEFIRPHLTGERQPIGVYPMVHRQKMTADWWEVKWGCIDFDEGEQESWVHALNVYNVATAMNLTAWIERSRSKGYHVWFFSCDWVPAEVMRHALLGLCQVAEAPTKEINPKQVSLEQGQLGNYVRLPYPGHLGAGPADQMPDRRVVVAANGTGPMSLESFVDAATQLINSPADFERTADTLYTPPAPRIIQRDWSGIEFSGDALERLHGKARIIFEDGPIGGAFRGHTLFKLACYLREDGKHSMEEALELLRDADQRWGKFHQRPDCEKYLQEMVAKAWSRL